MPWILSVDTASNAGSIAISRDKEIVGLVELLSEESHSVRLFAGIQFLLHQLRLPLEQVDAYAVTTGPGSFAGLRIGVSAMKGFAELYQKPMLSVSTLEAIAGGADLNAADSAVVALMDARRSELYAGVYQQEECGVRCVEPDRLVEVENFFAEEREGRLLFAGPEVEHFDRWIRAGAAVGWSMRRTTRFLAPAVARQAYRKFSAGETQTADQLMIQYIRRSDAELMFKG